MDAQKEYEPFGPEWQKEIMKLRKDDIVRILKNVGKERDSVKESLSNILSHIESGYLVRDTSKDHQPNWALKQLPFLFDLKEAKKLIEP